MDDWSGWVGVVVVSVKNEFLKNIFFDQKIMKGMITVGSINYNLTKLLYPFVGYHVDVFASFNSQKWVSHSMILTDYHLEHIVNSFQGMQVHEFQINVTLSDRYKYNFMRVYKEVPGYDWVKRIIEHNDCVTQEYQQAREYNDIFAERWAELQAYENVLKG